MQKIKNLPGIYYSAQMLSQTQVHSFFLYFHSPMAGIPDLKKPEKSSGAVVKTFNQSQCNVYSRLILDGVEVAGGLTFYMHKCHMNYYY